MMDLTSQCAVSTASLEIKTISGTKMSGNVFLKMTLGSTTQIIPTQKGLCANYASREWLWRNVDIINILHFLFLVIMLHGSSFSLDTWCVFLVSSLICLFLHELCAFFKMFPFIGVLTGIQIKQSCRMLDLFQSTFKNVKNVC